MEPTNNTLPSGVSDTLNRLNAPGTIVQQSAASRLDSADFLRLMTAQLANQDPLEPQSNDEMLAQLAQFSSLESSIEGNATLDDIASKLDALITAQNAAAEAALQAAEAAAAAAEAANSASVNPSGTQTVI